MILGSYTQILKLLCHWAARSCGSPDLNCLNSSFSSNASSETNLSENPKYLSNFGLKSLSSKSKEDLELPVDLSHTSNTPSGMIVGPSGDLVPAWVFCTRYSDRPSGGRARKTKKKSGPDSLTCQDKKPRTASTKKENQLPGKRLASKSNGGGTVLDWGVYCIQLALHVFGKEMPSRVVASGIELNEDGI